MDRQENLCLYFLASCNNNYKADIQFSDNRNIKTAAFLIVLLHARIERRQTAVAPNQALLYTDLSLHFNCQLVRSILNL